MKYVVDLVVNEIKNNINKNQDESLFLINGFEDLNIYLNIARKLTEYADTNNKSITIKLAKSKWDYFKLKEKGKPTVSAMIQNSWVLNDESTTEYRNKHASDILVLMGTELEDDLTGSLRDIFAINSNSLDRFMPRYNGKIDYSDIYSYSGLELSESEKCAINKLYRDLFELVNNDICKLSDICDNNIAEITNISEFISFFYKNLPEWGLPLKVLNLPKLSQLSGKNKKNLLRTEFNFINGTPFNNVSSAYKKYVKRIDDYNTKEKKYSEKWEGWNEQSIKSYLEFKEFIINFIQGNRSIELKSKLINFDFGIVEDILGFRVPSPKSQKNKLILKGDPLTVFSSAYLYALSQIKQKGKASDNIHFEFTSAELVVEENLGDDSDVDLINSWKNICYHTNGVLEKIDSYTFMVDGDYMSLSYSPSNLFSISNDLSIIVHAASPTKKVNKISFEIYNIGEDKKICEAEWSFSNSCSWLYDFKELSKTDWVKVNNNAYIPLVTSKELRPLVLKSSEEEFFDYYNEKANFDFSFNILDYFNSNSVYQNSGLAPCFYDLGIKYAAFCNKAYKDGYFVAINDKVSFDLLNSYNELSKKILNKKFNENEYFIIDMYIHAFNIEEKVDSITSEKDIDLCVVPPWHPASIEKTIHQNLFYLDGCYEFWDVVTNSDENNIIGEKNIQDKLGELKELSVFQNALDVFPISNSKFFGSNNSYGRFSLYTKPGINMDVSLKDLVKKEFVFDDDFNNHSYSNMNENSYMIYDVLTNYIKAFPNSKDKLNLVFIDPSDLQPIISSLQMYIKEYTKEYGDNQQLSMSLSILVRPENKGGKNYITYWMNEFFDVDSSVKIKTYINEWTSKEELDRMLNGNNDIIFVMDLLKVSDYAFINKIDHYEVATDECYYPIVLRPSPVSNTSTKRRIELTQPQFVTATYHTQVVHYKKNLEFQTIDDYYAVQTVDINPKVQDMIKELHQKSYWVACVDSSIDGKLIKDVNENNEYSVIGFSTGKGKYGQYNVTITARNSILKSIENSFSRRLSKMFKWPENIVKQAAKKCMDEAAQLDGISVLTASNQKDYNINEFMAYVLTSLREKEKNNQSPLKIIVHLDSYMHWFSQKSDIKNIFDENSNESRPDFLLLKISKDFDKKIKIKATVIECKMARLSSKESHVEKAIGQVKHGIDILSDIFDPCSQSLKRRYWYAQLYRALTFAQISFNNSSKEFTELSNKLRNVLNGDFEIEWNGEILGYWLDMDGDDEIEQFIDNKIVLHNIPQKRIQELILGNLQEVQYVDFTLPFLSDREEYLETVEKNRKKQKKITLSTVKSDIKDFDNSKGNEDLPKENDIDMNSKIGSVPDSHSVEIQGHKNSDEKQENSISNSMTDNDYAKDNTSVDIVSKTEELHELEDIRVYIGKSRNGNDVYWEFGNPNQANRHMLITGTSGQGKTYSIQTMLYELSKENVSSVIFDYTEGFRLDQLEKEFVNRMSSKIVQHVVKVQGVPINPFKKHEIDIAGMTMFENSSDVASRFANILAHVYKFGEQQTAAIFEATRIGIEKYGENMNMERFKEELENVRKKNKTADSVLSKMTPFFYSVDFKQNQTEFDWGNIIFGKENTTTIFQLTQIDREMQVIVTELMLWDAWYYTTKHGSKNKPFVVVLDEAQNLSHKSNSPSAKILTEGRKFGWSAWFATQSLKVLSDDEIIRLLQSSFKLYFKPTDAEIMNMAKQLDPSDKSAWLTPLKSLKKGECIVVGDRLRKDGTFGAVSPTVTKIVSFESR